MKSRNFLAVGALAAAFGGAAPQAHALTQEVAGTSLETIALAAGTPVAIAGFKPGADATSTAGTVVATSTDPTWTLQAHDANTTTPGVLDQLGVGANPAEGATCTGSALDLGSAIKLTIGGAALTGAQSAGQKVLSGTAQTVASSTGTGLALPLAAAALTTTYVQSVPDSKVLTTGCIYGITTTFTLAG